MKRVVFRIFMVFIFLLSLTSQAQSLPGLNEPFESGSTDREKKISICFERLMRDLRSIDSICNNLSSNTMKLENNSVRIFL